MTDMVDLALSDARKALVMARGYIAINGTESGKDAYLPFLDQAIGRIDDTRKALREAVSA